MDIPPSILPVAEDEMCGAKMSPLNSLDDWAPAFWNLKMGLL